jgi:hypothetical protein
VATRAQRTVLVRFRAQVQEVLRHADQELTGPPPNADRA